MTRQAGLAPRASVLAWGERLRHRALLLAGCSQGQPSRQVRLLLVVLFGMLAGGCTRNVTLGHLRPPPTLIPHSAEIDVSVRASCPWPQQHDQWSTGSGFGEIRLHGIESEVVQAFAASTGGLARSPADAPELGIDVDVRLDCIITAAQKFFTLFMVIGTLDLYPLLGGPFPTTYRWGIVADVYPTKAPRRKKTYRQSGQYEFRAPMYTFVDREAAAASQALTRGLQAVIDQVSSDRGALSASVRRASEAQLAEEPDERSVQPDTRVQRSVLSPVAQRWAVLVGVSRYLHAGTGGLRDLRYAARDAKRLYEQLVGADAVHWPKENVRLLTDTSATREAVSDAVLNFLKRAQKNDLVLVFFSGHGSPDPTRPKNNYFLCHDTDPRRLTTSGFPMWELDNALERRIVEAQCVVVLADACHSGGFAPEGMKDLRIVSRNVSEGIEALGKRAHCRVVTSCEPGELSQEKAQWGGGHGAFAYAVIKGLSGAADSQDNKNSAGDDDGRINLDELVHYVRREVGDLTSNGQHVVDRGRLNAVLR